MGVGTCPPPSSSAAGWGGRGRWRSDAGPSFSAAAWRTAAESLGGLASAAAPANGAPSPEAARWASRSAGLDGLDGLQRQGWWISEGIHEELKRGSPQEKKNRQKEKQGKKNWMKGANNYTLSIYWLKIPQFSRPLLPDLAVLLLFAIDSLSSFQGIILVI